MPPYILLSEQAQKRLSKPCRARRGREAVRGNRQPAQKAFEYARVRAAKRPESPGWLDLVSVGTLPWRDFRHEAISRCFDAGWTSEQVMDFSGHVDVKSLLRYRHFKVDESVARLRALKKRQPAPILLPGMLDGRVVEDHANVDG